MNLTANTRQDGDVIILDLRGRIVLGEESAAFREQICDLLAEGHRKILLNLADAHYIDSTGLAHLVGALVSVRKLNGEIKLLNLSNRFHDLLQVTKLHTVLESFDNEATAVESFVHSVAASGVRPFNPVGTLPIPARPTACSLPLARSRPTGNNRDPRSV